MLHFSSLTSLLPHYQFIKHQINTDKPFFFVGGTVRDLLLGIITEPVDLDLTCSIHPDELKKYIQKDGISMFDTEKYGTITLIPKQSNGTSSTLDKDQRQGFQEKEWVGEICEQNVHKQSLQYEITPFRTESGYSDIRHPDDIIWSDSLIEDSKRRDFTINAMYATILEGYICVESVSEFQRNEKTEKLLKDQGYIYLPNNTILIQNRDLIYNLTTQGFESCILNFTSIKKSVNTQSANPLILLLDPQLGFNDLCNRELKAVGNPLARMNEDALRILRGARFVNTLNQSIKVEKITQNPSVFFDFDNATWKAMQKSFYLITKLPKERLHQELIKVFSKNKPFEYIALLDELGLIPHLFPSLERCKNILQPVRYHPLDVYIHTLMVLRALQERNKNPLLKLAALYHDVGKVDQFHFFSLNISKEEKELPLAHHMYHTHIGPGLAKQDFGKLGCSNKEIDEICRYISKHHRPGEILDANPKNRTKKLRELLSEGGFEQCQNLLDLAIADRIGQMNPVQGLAIDELLDMKQQLTDIYATEGQFTIKQLAINGNILMKKLDIQPGKELGELLQKSFEFARDNPSQRNTEKELLTYIQQYRKQVQKKQSGKKK